MRAEYAHECGERDASKFGTLPDANSVKPNLFNDPQQPQLMGAGRG